MADPRLVEELFAGPHPCCLTTLGAADVRRDPRVALVVVDTENILRHVSVDGVVAAIEPDTDYAHIDSLSLIYEGRRYQYSTPEDVPRFRVEIEARRIRTVDISPPAD